MPNAPLAIPPRLIIDGISPNTGEVVDFVRLMDPSEERYYIETVMGIISEEEGKMPFLLNPIQAEMQEKRWRREIVLKARRVGISSLKLAQGLVGTMKNEGHVAGIMAHTPRATRKLFQDLKWMYELIDPRVKPERGYNNGTFLNFPKVASEIYIECAGATKESAKNVSRGGKVNYMHFSEYAFYKASAEVITATMRSVPSSGYASIESTPNGMNDFYVKVQQAIAGLGSWRLFFFPWFYDPKCWISINDEEASEILDSLSEQEIALIRRHNLKLEQIAWRRQAIADYPNFDAFLQENPEDPQSCFLSSGTPYFNQHALAKQLDDHKRDPLKKWGADGPYIEEGVRIFELPIPEEQYVMGADTSQGKATSHMESAHILKRRNRQIVATIYGRWSTHVYAALLYKYGMKYNTAYIGVENNNHGHAVLQALLRGTKDHPATYPTTHVYFSTTMDERRRPTMTAGWNTNSATRPLMLDQLSQVIDLNAWICPCEVTIASLMAFEDKEDGKPSGAEGGAPDDPVISLAIANQMLQYRPFTIQACNY